MDTNIDTPSQTVITPTTTDPTPEGIIQASSDAPVSLTLSTPTSKNGPRALRQRSSLPANATPPTRALRGGPPKDIEKILHRVSSSGISERKDELVKEKEGVLREVVDEHDTAVLEKFHLERYISLLEGWDPVHAKQEQSPVYLDYKRQNHNLLDLIPQTAQPVAGPSRARATAPARTTRRKVNAISEIFSVPAPPPPRTNIPTSAKGKGKAKADPDEIPAFETPARKGKGRASFASLASNDGIDSTPIVETLPPQPGKKGKGRRATIGVVEVEPEEEVETVTETPGVQAKGKKRGRPSLPNPSTKKLRTKMDEVETPSSPAVDTPVEETPREAASPPPVAEALPSLAHVPFPPPPIRPRERVYGPKTMWYTDPTQIPPTETKFNGDISTMMNSYIHIEDTGPSPDLASLELRAARDAYFRNRVNYLQHQGRLLRLLDEAEADALATNPTSKKSKVPTMPARKTDHQDSLMAHMTQVRNAILGEAKMKPVVCKKVARMIMAYWEYIEGKAERDKLAEEREMKRKAKDLVRAVRKRWALAVKIVRAKMLEAQKAEQDRLGKAHLQNMLQRSSGLLEAQRDDIVGQGGIDDDEEEDEEVESDEDNEDSDDPDATTDDEDDGGDEADNNDDLESDASGRTDEVSAADDEDGEEEAEEDKAAAGSMSTADGVQSAIEDADELEQEDAGEDEEEDEDEDDSTGDESADGDTDIRRLILDDEEEDAEEPAADVDMGSQDALHPLEPSNKVDPANEAAISPSNSVEANVEAMNTDALSKDALIAAVEMLPAESTTAIPVPALDKAVKSSSAEAPVDHAVINGTAVIEGTAQEDAQSSQGIAQDIASTTEDVQEAKATAHPSPRLRSRRARKSRSVSAIVKVEDPDADDVEFEANRDELSDQDHALDVEMEDAGSEDRDSEDEGLLADADLPIEVLLKRYGYPVPNGSAEESAPNGDNDVKPVETDKSLLDDALANQPQPGLIVEGKRNRRVRTVWTPEDNPPHPPPAPKKARIEEVESDREMTPELSTDEGSDAEEDEAIVDPEDANRVRPPFLLRGTLRPYQQAGLEWLASLYANKMNGILADEMGLGKTIQTIALLGHLACDKGVWGQHLIIVPTSVILNWEMEFKKFLPGIKVLTYYGNQKERKDKRKGWHTENTWQVCITSYQIVLADQHIFRRKNWVYMILDEAHNIKNFRSQRWQTLLGFKASRRLLLTGTPLQNNLMELWSLLYFLMPNGVGADATAVVGFANHKEFSEWFSNPMDKAIETSDALDEETLETVAKLHTLLRPFILRRLKSEVETQLPGKFEHVVYCKLSKRQRFLYDEFMSRASTKEALTSGGYLGVVNTLMQLRKVCNHPDLFEVRPVRTSFAMERSVLSDYEPAELIVRKRLLERTDELDLQPFNLFSREDESAWVCKSRRALDATSHLPHEVIQTKGRKPQLPKLDTRTLEGWTKYRAYMDHKASMARWGSLRQVNQARCAVAPVYGSTLLDTLRCLPNKLLPGDLTIRSRNDLIDSFTPPVAPLIHSFQERAKQVSRLVDYYAVMPPNVVARDLPRYALPGLTPDAHPDLLEPDFDTLHQSTVKLQIAFPDLSLLQYDCGKLQKLDEMLRDLKAGGHRVLIFTQMTRVLDILEMFLSYNGHRYLRLDGSTKIEDRQIITERFNSDSRIFCFIASSRSGGVGINLTGADTVFFYDSDWNPSMDRQCMDRAHRIGQTREVHIYRFVSIHTVEENMLKKANQKRLLDRVVIQEGDFTTEFFGKMDWRDIIDTSNITDADRVKEVSTLEGDEERVEDVDVEGTPTAVEVSKVEPRAGEERELARALAEVEDEEDAAAARVAQGEGELDFAEFGEGQIKRPTQHSRVSFASGEGSATPMDVDGDVLALDKDHAEAGQGAGEGEGEGVEVEEEEEEDEVGAVDEYMLKWVEENWEWFVNY